MSGEQTTQATPDLSGVWRVLKQEGLDAWLLTLGMPWAVRQVALRSCVKATDIIRQSGTTVRIVTVNQLGSWSRGFQEGRHTSQRAADGRVCKVTSCWEGHIHKATLQCERYAVESWRRREGRIMAVRSDLQMADGRRATLLWFLEQVAVPNKPRGCLPSRNTIKKDQKRVRHATQKDNGNLLRLLQDLSKWETPADTFIPMGAAAHKDVDAGSMSSLNLSEGGQPGHAGRLRTHDSVASAAPSGQHSAEAQPDRLQEAAAASISQQPADQAGPGEGSAPPGHQQARLGEDAAPQQLRLGEGIVPLGHHQAGAAPQGSAKMLRVGHSRTGSDGLQTTPLSASRIMPRPATLEELLLRQLRDFAESSGLADVVPVEATLASAELLQMGVEQAEETKLKLQAVRVAADSSSTLCAALRWVLADMQELERACRPLKRQKYHQGFEVCCCTLIFHRHEIASYLRTWEL